MAVNGGLEGIKLIAVNSPFLALSVIAVVLRLWSRRQRKQALQLNDWLILVALVFLVGQGVLEDVNVALGTVALDPSDGSPDAEDLSRKLGLPSAIIWGIPLLLIRISILHYYTKAFTCARFRKFTCAQFRGICIGMMVVVLSFFVAYVPVTVMNCLPVSMWWDMSTEGTCLDPYERQFVIAAVNVGVDALILLLALPVLCKVDMPHRKKVMGFFILVAGVGVAAIAGLRLLFISQSDLDSSVNYHLLSLLEADTGMIVACLPLMYPVAQRIWFGKDPREDDDDAAPSPVSDSRTPVLRRTPGSGSTLKPSNSQREQHKQHGEKSALAWPLANVDPELGMVHHEKIEEETKRTPSVEQAVHGRVSGGAKLVHLPPNAKRLSAEETERLARDVQQKRISPQDLESEWGRMTARQVQAASWGRNPTKPRRRQSEEDIPQIDQWFDGFDDHHYHHHQ